MAERSEPVSSRGKLGDNSAKVTAPYHSQHGMEFNHDVDLSATLELKAKIIGIRTELSGDTAENESLAATEETIKSGRKI